MKILITGTTSGIGRETALLFLEKGHQVIGFDREESSITNSNYTHYKRDVRDKHLFPELGIIDILVNNAGVQNGDDINVNLKGLINITEKYGIHDKIKSIVNIGSASAHTGAEFPEYSASWRRWQAPAGRQIAKLHHPPSDPKKAYTTPQYLRRC